MLNWLSLDRYLPLLPYWQSLNNTVHERQTNRALCWWGWELPGPILFYTVCLVFLTEPLLHALSPQLDTSKKGWKNIGKGEKHWKSNSGDPNRNSKKTEMGGEESSSVFPIKTEIELSYWKVYQDTTQWKKITPLKSSLGAVKLQNTIKEKPVSLRRMKKKKK